MNNLLVLTAISFSTFVLLQNFDFGDYPNKEVTVSPYSTTDLHSWKISTLIEVPPGGNNQDWVDIFTVRENGSDAYMTNITIRAAGWSPYGVVRAFNHLLRVERNGRTIMQLASGHHQAPEYYTDQGTLPLPTLMPGDVLMCKPLGTPTRLLLEGDLMTLTR